MLAIPICRSESQGIGHLEENINAVVYHVEVDQ